MKILETVFKIPIPTKAITFQWLFQEAVDVDVGLDQDFFLDGLVISNTHTAYGHEEVVIGDIRVRAVSVLDSVVACGRQWSPVSITSCTLFCLK